MAWVYLAIAVVILGLFVLQERGHARSGRAALAAWLAGSAVVDVLLWVLIAQPATWTLYVLYTWSGVFASLVVVRFWTLLGDLFSISQAKRVFAFIGAGGAVGAIGGSLIARALTDYLQPRHLLLTSALVLVATALATRFLLPRRQSTPAAERRVESVDLRWPLQAVWLRRVAGIVLLSAVTLTLMDFLFKSAVAAAVPPDELGSFFATTYLVLNALSLGAQLFVVSWVIRRLSVNRVLSVLPALVVSATLGVVLGGGLLAVLALKGCDGVLRHSLHRTALEVLYVPLTGDLRARVKGLIDVMGQRGGQAVASLFILVVTALSNNLAVFGVAVILLGVGWIRVAATLEAHYLDLFREALSGVAMRTRLDFPDMDLASLETLLTHLNSADDSEVIAALDMFAEQERGHLIPALVLYHPSDAVVLRALELFTLSGRQDFLAILGRLLEHDAPVVRAAALRAHAWAFGPRQELYVRFSDDPSPIVCATALVGLVSYGAGDAARAAREAIDAFAESGSHDERLALARAIRYSPGAVYGDVLLRLAETSEIDTRIAVVQAMREILSAHFIPVLVPLLPVRALRKEARATLVAIGTESLVQLDEILGDPETDPELPLDEAVLSRRLEYILGETFRLLDRRLTLETGAGTDAGPRPADRPAATPTSAGHRMVVPVGRSAVPERGRTQPLSRRTRPESQGARQQPRTAGAPARATTPGGHVGARRRYRRCRSTGTRASVLRATQARLS